MHPPTKVGDRVELIRADDPYTSLKPGDKGTVSFIDDVNTVHVNWDSGSSLGMIQAAGDMFKVLS